MKILIVEDDRKLSGFLQRAFTEEGYVADGCRSGADAAAQALAIDYDLVVLDWMLPGQDGLSVCRELRRRGVGSPILMLSARAEVAEKVAALDAGADDYVTKPFHLDELMARARALLRRGALAQEILHVGPITLDLRQRQVQVEGSRIELTAREFALLELLARNAGRLVTRAEILAQVWQANFDPESNVIDVHVSKVRDKLGAAATLLSTVRGRGYRLSPEEPT